MAKEIDTFNKFFVGGIGEEVVLQRPPMGPMSRDDALNLAAYLVLIADPVGTRFKEVREAICSA